MRFVVDASAVVDLLLGGERGAWVRDHLAAADDPLPLTVAHMDAEALSALARLHRAGRLAASEVSTLLERLAAFTVERLPTTGPLLDAAWARRDNVATRDALYVAAAEAARAQLLTTDERLARAVPGLAMPL